MFVTRLKNAAIKCNWLLITVLSVFSLTANAVSNDAFSHLEMRNHDDSVFFMDSYNRLKNDKEINSPVVQQNKQEILRFVNAFHNANKNKDTLFFRTTMGIPDFIAYESHRFEDTTDSLSANQKSEGADINYNSPWESESSLRKTIVRYVTLKGDTVEKDMSAYVFAEEYARQVERVNARYSSSDNDYRYADIMITALSEALQDSSKAMDRFIKETEQRYINNELAQYGAKKERIKKELADVTLETKADSISFAKGYFTGKNIADTLSFKDNYNFFEGASIGYRTKNIGKIGWLQIINIMESKPLASQPQFMLGIEVGSKGEKDGYEPTFIAGAYYGYAGERTQWQAKDMEAYLKKNGLDPITLFGTWKAYKVDIVNEKYEISYKDKSQSTKEILKYKMVIVDDYQFKFNKGKVKQEGEYYMKKGELILQPFSYRVSFKEDKPVSEKVAETNKFYIVSRTENEMILGADCRDCYVIIYFRKK